jgi:lipid A 3-O-deacylase
MYKSMRAAGLVVALMLSAAAQAVDGVAFELGKEGGHEMVRAAVQWQWQKRWLASGGRHVGGYWEVSAGTWRDAAPAGQNNSVTDFGLTPVFRWQSDDLRGVYVEGGIGAHYISRTALGGKRFGSHFQFGDHLGFGVRFGPKAAYDLGYRFQHISNADIKKPNDGIDFHQIRLQYWFR